ncbi:unnamed protein product [Aphis gossypii]|uniref:Uncharacterized protein n=1 Tax=Aphis gossypii TaxID=80765 RepID=A0A9P0IHX3_APHGO|nr:unnamed protein product [Aphis gossypii]
MVYVTLKLFARQLNYTIVDFVLLYDKGIYRVTVAASVLLKRRRRRSRGLRYGCVSTATTTAAAATRTRERRARRAHRTTKPNRRLRQRARAVTAATPRRTTQVCDYDANRSETRVVTSRRRRCDARCR